MMLKDNIAKLVLFNAITVLLWFSSYTYVPVLSVYLKDLGISYSMTGIILSSYGLTQLLFRIPFGILSDTYNFRKVFIFGGLFASAASSTGLYFFDAPTAILFFRGLAGVAVSTWAIYISTFISYFPSEEKAKSIGYINASFSFGQVAATFLGGIIVAACGARAAFALSAGAAVIGLSLSVAVPESQGPGKGALQAADFLQAARNKELIFFSALAAVMQVGMFAGVYGFMPTLLSNLGADSGVLGLAVTLATLPSIFSSFLSGTLCKKVFGLKNTVVIGFVLMASSLLMMAYASNIPLMLLLQVIGGLGKGLLTPTLTALAISQINPALQSTAISFFQAVYSLGMIGGPIIIGVFADRYGMASGFWIVTLLCLLAAGLAVRKRI
jgi:MFS family permease